MRGADKARSDEERLVREVAGLVSTVEFRPSWNHPERCLPIAEQIVRHLKAEAPPPEPGARIPLGEGFTEAKERIVGAVRRSEKVTGEMMQQRIGAPEPSAASGEDWEVRIWSLVRSLESGRDWTEPEAAEHDRWTEAVIALIQQHTAALTQENEQYIAAARHYAQGMADERKALEEERTRAKAGIEALRPFAAKDECDIGINPEVADETHLLGCWECAAILNARAALASWSDAAERRKEAR